MNEINQESAEWNKNEMISNQEVGFAIRMCTCDELKGRLRLILDTF